MEGAIFHCPNDWRSLVPPETRILQTAKEVTAKEWPILALTAVGCQSVLEKQLRCGTLLVPGELSTVLLPRIQAKTVIACGLSPRDSLTLSSLRETPVLCVQRILPRPDGRLVEPQEILLSDLPGDAEELLPLLGIRLLQMPLTDQGLLW